MMPRRYLNKKQVIELTGLSASTIDREIARGRFPKPDQLSARRVGWLETVIRQWQIDRAGASAPVLGPQPAHGWRKLKPAEVKKMRVEIASLRRAVKNYPLRVGKVCARYNPRPSTE